MNDDEIIKFLDKIETLSDEAQLYFQSKIIGQQFEALREKYKLGEDFLYELFYDIVSADFDFSLLEKGANQKELIIDVLGCLFLPVAPFIGKDVAAEITKRGGQIAPYQEIVDSFDALMEDENFAAIEELAKLQEDTYDAGEEESASLKIITEQLRGVLSETNENILASLNGAFIYLLINKPDFAAKASKALLSSPEMLTEKGVVLDGKLQPGTVANWLKDFISQNGSEMFNVVVMSKYLATAQSVKNLGEKDRLLLRRLLKFYRSLVFYPESMAGLSSDEWTIIPIEKEFKETPIKKKEPVVKKPEPELEVVTEPIILKKAIPATPAPVVSTPTPVKAPADDLEKLLANYPAGSLERRALEQEIKKRQTKI